MKKVFLASLALGLLAVVVLASYPGSVRSQSILPPFEYMIAVLADAEDKGLLTEDTKELMADWFIENLLAPGYGESTDRIRERLSVRAQPSLRFLISVLADAKDKGVLPDEISELLSDLLTHDLIAPHTGETPEQIVERLSAWPARNVIPLLPPDDRAVLIELYNATDGPNWADNTNWLSDRQLGEWYGVVVNDAGRVIALVLEENRLIGEIPPSLGRLASLETLALSNNRLSGSIPPELSNLTELKVLVLWVNQLSGPIPPQLGSLTKLEVLFLGRNRLSGPIPPELRKLSNLTHLNLAGNQLFGCVPEVFFQSRESEGDSDEAICVGIDALSAFYEFTGGSEWTNSANWLGTKPLPQWHGVVDDRNGRVVSLDLGGNNLVGTIPPEIGQFPNLESLFLHGNRLSGQLPPELGELSRLNRLFVGGNRFDGCIPDSLEDVTDSDLHTLNLAFCDSGKPASWPSTDVAVFSHSPTRISMTWSCGLDIASAYEIYRNERLITSLPPTRCSYTDENLEPNTRYEYRIEIHIAEGQVESDSATVATLAYPPTTYLPGNITESGFELAIMDDLNPPATEYRVKSPTMPVPTATPPSVGTRPSERSEDISLRNFATLPAYPITVRSPPADTQAVEASNDDPPNQIPSDWSASRCRTFDDLQDSPIDLGIVSRNLDGIETKGRSQFEGVRRIFLQGRTGNDDPWARARIEDASNLYGLTERARGWMLSDIPVTGHRNEPGYAGFDGISPDDYYGVGIGYPVGPGTLMHEMMHGFWEHWDGFPERCDVMNLFAFHREVAQFMLDFRKYDHDGQPNPWEEWRPFYNYLVGISENYVSPDGRGLWELLQQGEYDELWHPLYHLVDTEVPSTVAGKISLIPPPLRPYFKGFIADSEDTTWRDELLWYTSLPSQERRLWDTAYNYHSVPAYLPEYTAPPDAPATGMPPEILEMLRNADRQILVDFINTLEDISCNLQSPCKTLWDSDFGFWTRYVEANLYRSQLYLEELSPSIGIELEPSNLKAAQAALRFLVLDVSACGDTGAVSLRASVNSIVGITDVQRAAFLAMIEVRERNGHWNVPCIR